MEKNNEFWNTFAEALEKKHGENLFSDEDADENNPYHYWLQDVSVEDIVSFTKKYIDMDENLNRLENWKEDYERKIKSCNELLLKENDNKETVERLKTKRGCYRTFITEIDREIKEIKSLQ